MTLLDTLRERTAHKGRTAQVDCGELGTVTVEALTPAECGRLTGNSRALLYAACRELQEAGEALRKERKLFRPDEILEYLSNEEADAAAAVIRAISGSPETTAAETEVKAENAITPAAGETENVVTTEEFSSQETSSPLTTELYPATARSDGSVPSPMPAAVLEDAVPVLAPAAEATAFSAPTLHSASSASPLQPELALPQQQKNVNFLPSEVSRSGEEAPVWQLPDDTTPQLAEAVARHLVKQLRLAAAVR